MKLYVFQETGEFRVAGDGEWYQDSDGDFMQADGPTYTRRKIVVMTEMNFPNSTSRIQITPYEGLPTPWPMPAYTTILSIVRPKRKVKKWQWLFKYQFAPDNRLTKNYYATEEDVLKVLPYVTALKKLEESEIEEDE